MEAVIATGGKQYRVAPGQVISIEKLPGETGSSIEFRSVLLVTRDGEVIADPKALTGARVSGEVVGQGRGRKVRVVKLKRRRTTVAIVAIASRRRRAASPTSRSERC